MSMNTSRDRLVRFLGHLDSIFEVEPELFPFDSKIDGAPKIVVMVYRDVPEAGSITGITYGISEIHHPDWKYGRPELTISVDSDDVAWPLAVGDIANQLRGSCPFTWGSLLNFGEKISASSDMSAFFIFAPSILERDACMNIDIGGDLPIHLGGVYPIYDDERQLYLGAGLENFWHGENFDLYDVNRPRVIPRASK